MLTATDDRVLLSLRPPFLVVPAPGLPDGVQLRVRAAPEGNAAEASFSFCVFYFFVFFFFLVPANAGGVNNQFQGGLLL